jgi:hypothetical protein
VPEVVRVTFADVTVVGSSGRDTTAVTAVLRSAPEAPFVGDVVVTVAAVGADVETVKLQEYAVPSVAPSVAAMPPASFAV